LGLELGLEVIKGSIPGNLLGLPFIGLGDILGITILHLRVEIVHIGKSKKIKD